MKGTRYTDFTQLRGLDGTITLPKSATDREKLPGDMVSLLINTAYARFQKKDYRGAVGGYSAAIKAMNKARKESPLYSDEGRQNPDAQLDVAPIDRRMSYALISRGAAYQNLGQHDKALKDYQDAQAHYRKDSPQWQDVERRIKNLEKSQSFTITIEHSAKKAGPKPPKPHKP